MIEIEKEKKKFLDSVEQEVKNRRHVFLYGAGVPAEQIYKELFNRGIEIDGFVVTNPEHNRTSLFGKEIIGIDSLNVDKEETLIVIATMSQYNDEIYKTLCDRDYKHIIQTTRENENIFTSGIEQQRRNKVAIEITTKIGCAINCRFCPQGALIQRYFENNTHRKAMLSYEDFAQCLKNLPKDAVITFSGFVEPFHNPRCADMICLAADMGFQVSLHTTLDGASMEDIKKIKDVPFEYVTIHLPDNEEYAHIRINDQYLEVLDAILEMKNKEGRPLVHSANSQGTLHPMIQKFIRKRVKYTDINLIDRAGLVEEVGENIDIKGKIYCPKSPQLKRNVLLPDGTLVLCCMDFGLKHEMGNLIDHTYEEIRKTEQVLRIRQSLLEEDSNVICRNCSIARNI